MQSSEAIFSSTGISAPQLFFSCFILVRLEQAFEACGNCKMALAHRVKLWDTPTLEFRNLY